jgi:hypothetical protein
VELLRTADCTGTSALPTIRARTSKRACVPRKMVALTAVVLAGAACSGAQLVLKSPIQARCTDAGLKGCEDLTDGILEYVEGDREEAKRKIHEGVIQNEPDQLHEFAAGVRALKAIPGVDQFARPLLEVADFLAPEKGESRAVAHRTKGHANVVAAVAATDEPSEPHKEADQPSSVGVVAEVTPVREPPSTPPPRLMTSSRAGTVVPASEESAVPCVPFADARVDVSNVVGRCATVATGPLIVTDIWTTGTCANDLFIGTGVPGRPRWAVSSIAPTPLNIHGASLPVAEGESLFVAQAALSVPALRHDLRCAVTWAGMHSAPP